MTVLIDARNHGIALQAAQKSLHLRTAEILEILRVSKSDWRRYCRGVLLVPQEVLIRLFSAGLAMLSFRYRVCPTVKDIRRGRRK